MLVIQLCKVALVASVAFFFTLIAYGNIADYGSNWAFVQHVLSMDTTSPDSTLHWRAITTPTIQTVGYWMIIAAETLTAILLWAGVVRLLGRVGAPGFTDAKPLAVVGLVLGFLIFAVGFVAVGGEWFAMWQSQIWNGQTKAFEFLSMISAVLIILLLPERWER